VAATTYHKAEIGELEHRRFCSKRGLYPGNDEKPCNYGDSTVTVIPDGVIAARSNISRGHEVSLAASSTEFSLGRSVRAYGAY
jgi:hypothetical protein